MNRRTVMAASLAALSPVATSAETADPSPPVQVFGVVDLPGDANHQEIGVTRLIIQPGEMWDWEYPGRLSVRVESGTMVLPEGHEYRLEYIGIGGDPACPEPEPSMTTFTCGLGFYAKDGKYGSIHSVGPDPLSILMLFEAPAQEF